MDMDPYMGGPPGREWDRRMDRRGPLGHEYDNRDKKMMMEKKKSEKKDKKFGKNVKRTATEILDEEERSNIIAAKKLSEQ